MSPPAPSSFDRLIPPEIKSDPFYQAILNVARDPAVKTVLEIGSSAGEGSTEAWVREQVHDLPNTIFYACGPNPLVEFAEDLVLRELAVPKAQMKTEKWG